MAKSSSRPPAPEAPTPPDAQDARDAAASDRAALEAAAAAVDWRAVFEVAAQQRDEANRNFANLQVQLILEQRRGQALAARVQELEAELAASKEA